MSPGRTKAAMVPVPSAELTLKALLEKAGMPVSKIRKRSHDLRGLLKDISDCEVEVEVTPGAKRWVPGSRVRAVSIDLGLAHIPIGTLIDAEDQGASRYPNEIRYGDQVVDFKPSLVSAMAILLAEWARDHWNVIRYLPK